MSGQAALGLLIYVQLRRWRDTRPSVWPKIWLTQFIHVVHYIWRHLSLKLVCLAIRLQQIVYSRQSMQVLGHVRLCKIKLSHALCCLHINKKLWERRWHIWVLMFLSLCLPPRLPLSCLLQVYGIGWNREAPAHVFQQDAPHIQQYKLVYFYSKMNSWLSEMLVHQAGWNQPIKVQHSDYLIKQKLQYHNLKI